MMTTHHLRNPKYSYRWPPWLMDHTTQMRKQIVADQGLREVATINYRLPSLPGQAGPLHSPRPLTMRSSIHPQAVQRAAHPVHRAQPTISPSLRRLALLHPHLPSGSNRCRHSNITTESSGKEGTRTPQLHTAPQQHGPTGCQPGSSLCWQH